MTTFARHGLVLVKARLATRMFGSTKTGWRTGRDLNVTAVFAELLRSMTGAVDACRL